MSLSYSEKVYVVGQEKRYLTSRIKLGKLINNVLETTNAPKKEPLILQKQSMEDIFQIYKNKRLYGRNWLLGPG